MKREIIVLALCIVVFSVQFPIGHTTFDVNQTGSPDLVVTDFWQQGAYIYYQVLNVGNDLASGVHVDALFINGNKTAWNSIDASLDPGEDYTGTFPFSAGEVAIDQSFSVIVQTDVNNNINESNETNNSLEKIWGADSTPPVFLSQPTLDSLTETSAVISWVTDEYSDSRVEYGKASGIYDLTTTDSEFVTLHAIKLLDLDAHTTYHFIVQSADTYGNTAQSEEKTFETMAVSDNIIPTILMESIPSAVQGKLNIQPAVSDDTGIEKVEYSIDGALLFTAYSPPYTLPLDTSRYFNGQHALAATAYDLAGNSESDQHTIDISNVKDNSVPTIIIRDPTDGAVVTGIVEVKAWVEDDVGLDAARFYVNGSYTEYTYLNGAKYYLLSYKFDARNLKDGSKLTFAIMVTDTSSNVESDNVRVFVQNTEPEPVLPNLKVTKHCVERLNNVFSITLEVENMGEAEAIDVRILDGMKGFQPISTYSRDASYSANYDSLGKWACMYIHSTVSIPAGASHTYTYNAVPVLLSPSPPTPVIGFFIDLYYNSTPSTQMLDSVQLPVYKTDDNETIIQAHEEAVKTCDYLIVTDPYRLFTNFNPSYYLESIFNPSKSKTEVNNLLSTMAQLAFCKQGTLGYFAASSVQTLKNLIIPGGDWAKRMNPVFSQAYLGYLLIVGENEIVPTLHTFNWDMDWSDGSTTNDVYYSDQYYADTSGNWGCPELNVGRIIGNKPSNMTNAIQTSINVYVGTPGYGFDYSEAALLSGTGKGQDDMVSTVEAVKNILKKKGLDVWTVHEKDWSSEAVAFSQFQGAAKGADVVYMHAHGSSDSCGFLYTNWLPAINFSGSNPIVFATSCSTGDYESGDDYNIAEAFLDRGAAVYIGSTQVSDRDINGIAGTTFFEHVLSPYEGAWMTTFTAMERMFSSIGSDCYDFWVVEYNVYGDPKFGLLFPSAMAYSSMESTQYSLQQTPLSSIDVNVPDYVTTQIGSLDHVVIPDGTLLLEVGQPQVPIYCSMVDYPKGVKVQNVMLSQRSGLTTGSGLNLPITSMEFNSPSSGNSALSEADGDWCPEKDYQWKVLENPDGTTTLVITMYPFHYNPLTTDFRFYTNYHFDVSYIVSQVEITDLSTDKNVYRQGDPLKIDMMLTNTGASQDVIVNTVIKRSGQDEIVRGFALRTLKEFKASAASFSEQCDTTGFVPGYYYAEVALKDTNGELLDKKTQVFKLGISSIEIKDFSAAPKYFGLGNDVLTRMTLRNNGTVDISGTAVTRILDSAGQLIQEFKNAIVDLSPSADITITNVWSTAGVAEGSYNVVGYVLYNDEVSDIQAATVQTDYVPPSLTIETPLQCAAVQDGVNFTISARDLSGVASVMVSLRSAQGNIISSQFELMPATLKQDGKWHLYFDTRQLPDGFYSFVAKGTDVLGNWGTKTVKFSIRNWAAIQMLPSTPSNKAGRTMPIKFSIRVKASVDPAQPFIYNEELTIKIYKIASPNNILLQTSTFGSGSTNYRIDTGTLYITNFKTQSTPATYLVNIYRKGMLIGSFQFSTVK
jgi:hypothetical protein